MILLDSNVISELMRRHPAAAVSGFLLSFAPEEMFASAITEAEIRYGLARMPPGRKREALAEKLELLLAEGLGDRILPFDSLCAGAFARIRAARDATGRPMSVPDALIGATAIAYDAILATRDTGGFEGCDVRLVDPWIVS